ncbi:Ig-like domain-containing protein [Curtobacterium sp. NPDC087082]|uniref:Ig-like domain-containing protein n=1 Tax=Curtobacterium sp. NPDC087082 TaxID=3363966 RepID=UPI0038134A4F
MHSTPRRAVASAALTALVVVGGGLATAVATTSPAHAVAPFPVTDPFVGLPVGTTMPAGWTRIATDDGQAAIVDHGAAGRWLRLTDDTKRVSSAVYNESPYDSSHGLTVEFDQRMWSTTDTGYADGIGFFLQDAAVPLDAIGPVGAGLGYHDGTRPCEEGLDGGVVGIGFDRFGNFARPDVVPNAITVRGPERECYPALATTGDLGDGFLEDRETTAEAATHRHVQIDLLPTDAGGIRVLVAMSEPTAPGADAGELREVVSADLPATALPEQVRFGFSASTGGRTQFHEIRNLRATQPTDVVTTAHTLTNAPVTPGEDVTFELRSVNDGPATIGGAVDAVARTVAVTEGLPLTDVRWTCRAEAGATCGAAAGQGAVAADWSGPPGGAVTIAVRGTVPVTTRSGLHTMPVESVTDFTSDRLDAARPAIALDGSVTDVDLSNNADRTAFEVVLPEAVAVDDEGTTKQGEPVTIDVLGNDPLDGSSADPDSLRLSGDGIEGAELSADGKRLRVPGEGVWTVEGVQVTFTPESSFSGPATAVRYQVTTHAGQTVVAVVRVVVEPVESVVVPPTPGPGADSGSGSGGGAGSGAGSGAGPGAASGAGDRGASDAVAERASARGVLAYTGVSGPAVLVTGAVAALLLAAGAWVLLARRHAVAAR